MPLHNIHSLVVGNSHGRAGHVGFCVGIPHHWKKLLTEFIFYRTVDSATGRPVRIHNLFLSQGPFKCLAFSNNVLAVFGKILFQHNQ